MKWKYFSSVRGIDINMWVKINKMNTSDDFIKKMNTMNISYDDDDLNVIDRIIAKHSATKDQEIVNNEKQEKKEAKQEKEDLKPKKRRSSKSQKTKSSRSSTKRTKPRRRAVRDSDNSKGKGNPVQDKPKKN